jgi:hypothetical protein
MENPLHKVETAIAQRVNETVHQASEKLYQRVEQLTHQGITRSHLETILADAILQTLSHLARRYWYVLGGGIVGLLVLQALLLKVVLQESQDCVKPISPREQPFDRRSSLPWSAKPL